jgi:hypothetical protein
MNILREIKWFIQRGKRGYAEKVNKLLKEKENV